MKKTLQLLVAIFFMSSVQADKSVCNIAPIPEAQVEEGCGCTYSIKDHAKYYFYFQSYGDFTNPIMFIDGKLVKVQPVKVEVMPDIPRLGDKFSQMFEYNGTTIVFDNVVSFVCPPNSEGGCEVTSFNTNMKITSNQCVSKPISINGDCGC